ncbi:MAG: TonB-dependent receptor, partial [Candidatus Didemnitutus sp.]|nr:TonB-dependent receptor [Candidatus Didemnitutus sp.]
INALVEIFNEKYYEHLDGGILESMGRMFKHAVKLYVYPMRQETYAKFAATDPSVATPELATGELITARNVAVAPHLRSLYRHILENGQIDSVSGYNEDYLLIYSREVLEQIQSGDPAWERLVPAKVAAVIKQRNLLGYNGPQPVLRP